MGGSSTIPRVGPGSAILDDADVPVTVAEPVTGAELKALLRVTGTAEDSFLAALPVRARLIAERLTGRTIKLAPLNAWWDRLPGHDAGWWDGVRDGAVGAIRASALELPRMPLVEVRAVRAYQDDDSSILMPSTDYHVDAIDPDLPGRVCLRLGSVWPTFTRPRNGFLVDFVAGYEAVPEDLKHAILLMASWLYKNRGDCSDAGCAGSCGAMSFLSAFIVMKGSA